MPRAAVCLESGGGNTIWDMPTVGGPFLALGHVPLSQALSVRECLSPTKGGISGSKGGERGDP